MNKYQKQVDDWFVQEGWEYWDPLAIVARLYEEGGEFSRVVNHVYGPKKKKIEEHRQDLAEEMGDIIYTLICFANSHGIDIDEATQKSIDKVVRRDKGRY